MTRIQIELPEATAKAAREAGLLTSQALDRLLTDALLRRQGADALLCVAGRVAEAGIEPMLMEEIDAEVRRRGRGAGAASRDTRDGLGRGDLALGARRRLRRGPGPRPLRSRAGKPRDPAQTGTEYLAQVAARHFIRRKRKRSGWSDEFATTVLGQMR